MASRQQPPHRSGRVVSVRLPDDLIERLDALAERTGRSRGMYLRLAVEATLPALERLHWEQCAARVEDRTINATFHALMRQLVDLPPAPGPSADDLQGRLHFGFLDSDDAD